MKNIFKRFKLFLDIRCLGQYMEDISSLRYRAAQRLLLIKLSQYEALNK